MFQDAYDAFLTIVEQQSMNKAAQYLHLSQPALSRKIQKLESSLGVPLFIRTGKKLELTRTGQICYDRLRLLKDQEHQMIRDLQMYRSDQQSQITIGASLTTLQSTLPELITAYTAMQNRHEIKVVTGKTHEMVNLVRERKVDLGLIATTIHQSGIECVPLFGDHLELVVTENHPLTRISPTINDLNQLPMILFSTGSLYRVLMDEMFQRYGIFPQVKMEIDSFEAMIRLVATFRVAALLPKSYLFGSMLSQNGLTVVELPELKHTIRETSLIYLEDEPLNPASLQFLAISKSHFAKS